MTLKKQAISGTKWVSISKISLALITIIKLSVLTRLLNSTDFGLMALVNFVLGFIALFSDLGFSSAILHKQDISRNQYASLFWVNIILSALLFLVVSASSPFIADYYKEPKLIWLIPLMSSSLIIMAIGRQHRIVEQKELHFKRIAITDMIAACIGLVLSIVLAYYGFGVLSLVYSVLLQYIIANALFFYRGYRVEGLKFYLQLSDIIDFLKIGLYQVGGQIVNYFNRDFDILIIGKLLGTETLGVYSLAKQLVTYPMSILNPITLSVATPILAKMQNEKEKLKDNYLKFVNIVSTVNFMAYAILFLFAYIIILVMYGEKFTSVTVLVQILSCYMFIRSINSPVGSLVIATGKTHLEFYWNLLVLMVLPFALYVGVKFGINGVAYSLLITMCILTILGWKLLVRKMIKVDFLEYIKCLLPNFKMPFHYLELKRAKM